MEPKIEYVKEALQVVLDIGSYMVASGAEIARAEDSVERMCRAFGMKKVETFALSYTVIVTVSGDGYDGLTEIRRVRSFDRNMTRLGELNALSRRICESHLTPQEARSAMEEIVNKKTYDIKQRMIIYALISSAFSLFFGGNMYDCIWGALIGVAAAPFDVFLGKQHMNRFIQLFLCSVYCGLLANVGGLFCSAITPSLVSIGNIMIFIPGVIFTCSIQELFAENMLSGISRLLEAILISLVIATGFALVNVLF